ncbi:hypothetical protein [Herbiconiux daphne]|uniref:Uncharacterized protein n=1 Tax=Herbiconiux daphne TaxID=2970914 RepID=A0ABT2H0N4_9MICO|nr:hypothetical protein [Herbiconiux daphne]MCS5733480.1 hypothetical protein [Herbiconiux daphne]
MIHLQLIQQFAAAFILVLCIAAAAIAILLVIRFARLIAMSRGATRWPARRRAQQRAEHLLVTRLQAEGFSSREAIDAVAETSASGDASPR